ncbi:hypothetical protein DFR36_106148 [Melaminivora alkalimesophila]|uniref:Uncharacterized protein n=2 Tax=Melaminivora alkalimesophila TaxID=1165852 RepID=A0A317R9V4_9BURK|nr:hypothetical protein [Melaminivora alkalimesophila]PWW45658.1 hypothetical protein DFR36_106148 [Melaminivora alkalimesophila]
MQHRMGRPALHRQAALDRQFTHAIAPTPGGGALLRATLAALRLHRPQVLERLVEQAGAREFAKVLARLSARQMVDALTLLPSGQRAAVCAALSPAARRKWHTLAAADLASEAAATHPPMLEAPHLRALAMRAAGWARSLAAGPRRGKAGTAPGIGAGAPA